MVLKEWAEVWNLYKACGRRVRHAIMTPHMTISYGYRCVLLVIMLLSALFFLAFATSVVGLAFWGPLLISGWLYIVATERAIAKEFAGEYEKHRIADYPLPARQKGLRYALFLQGLADQAWSRDDIERLRRVAETMETPSEPTLRPSQHPLVIFLVGLLAGLSLEWIKQSAHWKSGYGAIVLMIVVQTLCALVGILLLVKGVKHWPEMQRREIHLFLQWAEQDIADEKLTKGMELTC